MGRNLSNLYISESFQYLVQTSGSEFQNGLGNSFTRKIIQYNLEYLELKCFDSIIKASKELGIGKSNISGVLSGSRKTTGGFIFKYAD